MAACLSAFLPAWWELTDDQWVLDVIQNGYALTFEQSHPTLSRNWRPHESASSHSRTALQAEVRSLLSKRAIEQVIQLDSLGFYSHVFFVRKKNGQLGPVINLRPLNACLHCPHFKMETVADFSAAIQQGDWAMSVDLTDTYFHILIAPWFHKYLQFVVGGLVFQFRALPFGLPPAPLVCSRLLAPLAVHLHTCGILFHRYLDDLLIWAQSFDLCQQGMGILLRLLYKLGLGVNLAKSDLTPAQHFVYGGVRFQMQAGVCLPPPDCLESAREAIRHLLRVWVALARTWLSLLGILSSLEKLVPLVASICTSFTSASASSLQLGSTVSVARWRWLLQPRQHCDGGCHLSIWRPKPHLAVTNLR